MPITVVVGGQFGSEGKGKVAYFLASRDHIGTAVRVGGPNAGHTVIGEDGRKVVFRQLPTPSLLAGTVNVLPAGAFIDPEVLMEEIGLLQLPPDQLVIDPKATIITPQDKQHERDDGLRTRVGSTLSGTGAALRRRIARADATLAGDVPELRPYIRPAVAFLRARLDQGERVVIEGAQGFGLSLLHSPHYPFATSRDTTAAGCVSEAGLSPRDVDQIYLVIRAFPIRVPGNSGPLSRETDWETVTRESGSVEPIVEFTSVTKARRRVGLFDPQIVRDAIASNNPTHIALNHLDYVDARSGSEVQLAPKAARFLGRVEKAIGRRVDFVGLGPDVLLSRNSAFLQDVAS